MNTDETHSFDIGTTFMDRGFGGTMSNVSSV